MQQVSYQGSQKRCLREPTFVGPSASTAAGLSSHSTAGPSTSVAAVPTPRNVAVATIPKPRSVAASTERGRGRPKSSVEKNVATSSPKMVEMGVLHTRNGQTIINPGMPSERFRNVKFSAVVIEDIGHKSSSGVKWKGARAMTSKQLQEIRERKVDSNKVQSCTIEPRKLNCLISQHRCIVYHFSVLLTFCECKQ